MSIDPSSNASAPSKPTISARFLAVPGAALAAGTIGAFVELVADRWQQLRQMPLTVLGENLSFLFISHIGLCLVVCLVVGGIGALLRRLTRRSLTGGHPAALAWATAIAYELAIPAWMLAYLHSVILPGEWPGVAITAAAGLAILVPLAWVLGRAARTRWGRALGSLTRPLPLSGAAMLLLSIAFQSSLRAVPSSGSASWAVKPNTTPPARSGTAPNVVLIVFDALRGDRLSCCGYPRATTPNLDAFARNAAVFTRAISPGIWTIPGHASLFTGLFPSQHGATMGISPHLWLHDGFVTLAEALRDRGYQTTGFSNNPIVSPLTNLAQGFEQFVVPRDMMSSSRMLMLAFYTRTLGMIEPAASILGRWFIEDCGGRATHELAEHWLDQWDAYRPFFMFVNLMETHDPYQPPRAYREMFVRPEDMRRSYWNGLNDDTCRWPYALAGKPVYTARDLSILSDLYDARLREADDRFGDLMNTLARKVNLDETLIIVTADHGENLGEHGMLGHQFSVHNGLIHVPLIVRWPKVIPAQRVDRLVQSHDVYTSVLSWVGGDIRQSARIMTRSLGVAMQPTSQPSGRLAFVECLDWPDSELEMVKRLVPTFDPAPWRALLRAVLDDEHKQIIRVQASGPRFELYNMVRDFAEKHDLADRDTTTRARMIEQLLRWQASFKPFDPNQFAGPGSHGLDEEQYRRLRQLGYVQ